MARVLLMPRTWGRRSRSGRSRERVEVLLVPRTMLFLYKRQEGAVCAQQRLPQVCVTCAIPTPAFLWISSG